MNRDRVPLDHRIQAGSQPGGYMMPVLVGLLIVLALALCLVVHDGTVQNAKIVPSSSKAPTSMAPDNLLRFVQLASMASGQFVGLPATNHGLGLPIPIRPTQLNVDVGQPGSGSSQTSGQTRVYTAMMADIAVVRGPDGDVVGYKVKTWVELRKLTIPENTDNIPEGNPALQQ